VSSLIQDGPHYGAKTTVEAIRRLVRESPRHNNVRELAEDICRNIRAKDYASEILAIYQYVCTHTRYAKDPLTQERVVAPHLLCRQMSMGRKVNVDCDDYAALLCALCQSMGHNVRVVTAAFQDLTFQGERQYSHIFAQAEEPRTGTWITLDPVAPRSDKMLSSAIALKVWGL